MSGQSGAGERGRVADAAARAVEVAAAGRRLAVRRTGEATARSGQWAYSVLSSFEPPRVPVTEDWKLSVGVLVGRHPRTPGVVRKALGLLDRFGAVRLGPAEVGFDGDDVEWDKVLEVRTRKAFEMMTTQSLDREVNRIRELLPPLPGRKWVVTKAAEALTTIVLAALENSSEERLGDLVVPSEIVYKGLLGRRRTVSGGLFAVAVLAVVQESREGIVAMAEQHGIKVTEAEPVQEEAAARITTLRERTDAISGRLLQLQQTAREQEEQEEQEEGAEAAAEEAPELTPSADAPEFTPSAQTSELTDSARTPEPTQPTHVTEKPLSARDQGGAPGAPA